MALRVLNGKNHPARDDSLKNIIVPKTGDWVDIRGLPMVHAYVQCADAATSRLQGTMDPSSPTAMNDNMGAITVNVASDIYSVYPFVRVDVTAVNLSGVPVTAVWIYAKPYGA